MSRSWSKSLPAREGKILGASSGCCPLRLLSWSSRRQSHCSTLPRRRGPATKGHGEGTFFCVGGMRGTARRCFLLLPKMESEQFLWARFPGVRCRLPRKNIFLFFLFLGGFGLFRRRRTGPAVCFVLYIHFVVEFVTYPNCVFSGLGKIYEESGLQLGGLCPRQHGMRDHRRSHGRIGGGRS